MQKTIKKIILFAVLIGLVAGGYYYFQKRTTVPLEQRFRLQTITQGDVAQSVSANGTLNPVTLISVGAQVSGRVSKLYVDFNDHVEKGQILLELDDALFAAQIAQSQGAVMEELGRRRGEMQNMESDGNGRTRLEYRIPARGLIGFQGEFLTLTRGTGLMAHIFDEYAPVKADMPGRRNGVLISAEQGEAVAYALWKLQDRGKMFSSPGDKLYEGMVIGIHSRDNDLVVNPIKGKQLTNVRSSGTDEAVRLITPVALTLESAVEFIDDDELVEITPKTIRIRKRYLLEHERKRAFKE